jgi:hypothetical protein
MDYFDQDEEEDEFNQVLTSTAYGKQQSARKSCTPVEEEEEEEDPLDAFMKVNGASYAF